MAKKSNGGPSILVILIVSFFVMAWSVNNPRQAKKLYTNIIDGAVSVAHSLEGAFKNG
tara:strand:- start:1509 stop:1682 length:174 start_codon:yes stop_codon:yes gene_type:complete